MILEATNLPQSHTGGGEGALTCVLFEHPRNRGKILALLWSAPCAENAGRPGTLSSGLEVLSVPSGRVSLRVHSFNKACLERRTHRVRKSLVVFTSVSYCFPLVFNRV